MGIVPERLSEKVMFFQSRLGVFAAHAAEIGLSEEDVADLEAKVAAARAAALAQDQAQSAARAATSRYNAAVAALGEAGATAIMKIRTRAESTGDVGVYTLSTIPPIAARSPMPAPGTPTELKSRLGGNGSLILEWKCKNPRGSMGTVYAVSRQVGDGGPFVYLATVGEKRFVDETIPAGATRLNYRIQAMRSTKVGPANEFPITFGSNGMAPLPKFQSATPPAIIAA